MNTIEKEYELISMQGFVDSTFDKNVKLPFKTVVKSFEKGTKIVEQGAIQTHNCFIISGVLEARAFINNEEKIFAFFVRNEFAGKYSFFTDQKPSLFDLRCVTDCTIEMVLINDYSKALESSDLIKTLSLYIIESKYVKRVKKEMSFLTFSVKERYERLLISQPELIQQLSINRIARYLNIHPNSLSRIRKKIIDSEK